MQKRSLKIILLLVIPLTIGLVIMGQLFSKSEFEKVNGFTGEFAISEDGNIAYVNYNEGKPEIFLLSDKGRPIKTLATEKEVIDIVFSPEGTSLIYVVNDKEINPDQLGSIVYAINLHTLKETELFREDKLITEIALDPKDKDKLYYLRAGTFENYSPIARAYPHDFDIYSYSIKTNEKTRHTTFKTYGMTSLQISNSEEIAYIQMIDDFAAETAEDIFETNQKIFEIPLENPENLKVISDVAVAQDIYDMVYIEEYDTIIYQAVGQTSEQGTFEYELFALDLNESINTQLTFLKEYTEAPFYSLHDDKVYFIVDKQFAKQAPDYYLYKMNRDGSDVEEINFNLDSK